jgi:hypothetical protein
MVHAAVPPICTWKGFFNIPCFPSHSSICDIALSFGQTDVLNLVPIDLGFLRMKLMLGSPLNLVLQGLKVLIDSSRTHFSEVMICCFLMMLKFLTAFQNLYHGSDVLLSSHIPLSGLLEPVQLHVWSEDCMFNNGLPCFGMIIMI